MLPDFQTKAALNKNESRRGLSGYKDKKRMLSSSKDRLRGVDFYRASLLAAGVRHLWMCFVSKAVPGGTLHTPMPRFLSLRNSGPSRQLLNPLPQGLCASLRFILFAYFLKILRNGTSVEGDIEVLFFRLLKPLLHRKPNQPPLLPRGFWCGRGLWKQRLKGRAWLACRSVGCSGGLWLFQLVDGSISPVRMVQLKIAMHVGVYYLKTLTSDFGWVIFILFYF